MPVRCVIGSPHRCRWPRVHRHGYHRVLAPDSPLRSQVTALVREAATGTAEPEAPAYDLDKTDAPDQASRSSARYPGATLIARLFEIFGILHRPTKVLYTLSRAHFPQHTVTAQDCESIHRILEIRINHREHREHREHRDLYHLLQDPRLDLLRHHLLAVRLDPGIAVFGPDDLVGYHVDVALYDVLVEAPADQTLDGEQGVLGVGNGLPLGGLPDEDLAVAAEGHHGGGGPRALRVLDHLGIDFMRLYFRPLSADDD